MTTIALDKYNAIVVSIQGIYKRNIFTYPTGLYGILILLEAGEPKYNLNTFNEVGSYNEIGEYMHKHNLSLYTLGSDLVRRLGNKFSVLGDNPDCLVLHYGEPTSMMFSVEDFPIEVFLKLYKIQK